MVYSLLLIIAVIFFFALGYGFHRTSLKWKNQTNLAEQKANIHAEQLEATVSASLDGIVVISIDGKILEFSEAAEQIFGYRRKDIMGKNVANLIIPERYREAHANGLARIRQPGTRKSSLQVLGKRIEIETIRADGSEFMSEMTVSQSTNANGDILIAYIRDISEKRAAETALRKSKIKAEAASEAKSKFLATMSHELRTPFNAVLGILDIMSETNLNQDQRDLLKTAKASSVALLHLMNEVVDYAKITSGQFQLIERPFQAGDILKDVKSLFDPLAAEKNIPLTIKIEGDPDIAFIGDAGHLKQILINFVSNSVKFTKKGEIILSLKTHKIDKDKTELFYSVQDTGIGIPKKKQKEVFKEFYMVDASETREHQGTGLGLTISKRLVKSMNGRIGVDSEIGQGSCFWISIPLEKTVFEKTAQVMDFDSQEVFDNIKILLAEDNKINQMVTKRVLNSLNANVTIAENGQEVLDILDKQPVDVILMDISMPIMDGLRATQYIRNSSKSYKSVPIIALTAMANANDVEKFREAGMNAILIKPVDKSTIYETIIKHVNHFRQIETQNTFAATTPILNELFDGVTHTELQKFKTQLHDDLTEALVLLSNALQTNDRIQAGRASHVLKGLATTFGFSELTKIAELTNLNCKSDKNIKWKVQGQKTETIGHKTLKNIDVVFDQVKVATD